jgi:hypothetical protein
MAIGTDKVAFCDLVQDPLFRIPADHHETYIHYLLFWVAMVEVHANWIELNPAVLTGLLLEWQQHFFQHVRMSLTLVFLFLSLGSHPTKITACP